MLKATIPDRFTYPQFVTADKYLQVETTRGKFRQLYNWLDEHLPEGPEKSLTITILGDANRRVIDSLL